VREARGFYYLLKEAKAKHKLTADIISRAVGSGAGRLYPRAIMDRGLGLADPESGRLDVEACEYWFAAMCAQLYTSMIRKRLRYGMISTGECYVFTYIIPEDPSTLRYSLSKASPNTTDSPLMRLVARILLAMQNHLLPLTAELENIQDNGGLIWATASASFTTATSPDAPARDSGYDSYRDSSVQLGDREVTQGDTLGPTA
jgi:hypothetical protein